VSYQLKVGELIDSNIMQLIPIPFANELVQELLHEPDKEAEQEMAAAVEQIENMKKKKKPSIAKPEEDKEQTKQYIRKHYDQKQATIQQSTFSDFDQVELNSNEQKNLDMLLDIPLNIKVELGRTKRTIKDILELSSGSIIELDKL